jgi:type I restriction enzyme, S subunit
MPKAQNLIADNLDIWTTAIKIKSSAGRGASKKINLYGIKKLRELILELAVRGQLVPQNQNDEPASVLLEKIAKEKAQLIQEGKIKKQKVLPKISDIEKPFELPKGWCWAFIPQVLKNDKYAIKRGPFGSAIKKDFFVPTGYKVYEQQHAINNDFSLGKYYIDEKKFNELKAFEIVSNDLIISCSGTVGRVAVAPEKMEPGIINQALLKVSLSENGLGNNYFKILFPAYYMNTDTLLDLKGTAQKNMVSVETLKKEPFPLPPLSEQHRIVAKVDELMALCDELKQETEDSLTAHQTLVETLLATLTASKNAEALTQNWGRVAEHFDTLFTTDNSINQLKQTILQLAVMGKLVPQNPKDEPASVLLEKIAKEKAQLIKEGKIKKQKPLPAITDDEKPFELPHSWEWVRFSDLSHEVATGPFGTMIHKSDYIEGGVPLINPSHMINSKIIENKLISVSEDKALELKSYLLTEGDIVLARRGEMGRCALVTKREEGWLCGTGSFVLKFYSELSKEYILLLFKTQWVRTFLGGESVGITMTNLNHSILNKMPVPVPPEQEQQRIVAKVDELMGLCDQLQARLDETQTLQLHLADAIVEQAVA